MISPTPYLSTDELLTRLTEEIENEIGAYLVISNSEAIISLHLRGKYTFEIAGSLWPWLLDMPGKDGIMRASKGISIIISRWWSIKMN